jgi:hypothetical protein
LAQLRISTGFYISQRLRFYVGVLKGQSHQILDYILGSRKLN